jgi:thiamine biosynthesis protein ThiS
MKRWIPMVVVVVTLLFSVAAVAQGQVEINLNGEATSVASGTSLLDLVHRLGRNAGDVDVTHNGRAVKDRDLDNATVQAGDRVSIVEATDGDRFGFGVGFGLVNLDEEAISDDVETYFTAHVRIAFGDATAHRGGRRGLQGYFEPEIGIWDGDAASDTLIGFNIIGSIPFNAVDFFIGAGAAMHMIEVDSFVEGNGTVVPAIDEDALGVNAQFGIDVHLNENVTIFGTGRFDIIDSASSSLEAKVYLGLRFGF